MVSRHSVPVALLLGALLAGGLLMASGKEDPGEQKRIVGGCHTSEHDYGLPAIADSLAAADLDAALHGRASGKSPLFVQIGSVKEMAAECWISLGRQLTSLITEGGLRLASRSLLRHTTGTCFPPYHVDLEAVGDTAAVARFLEILPSHRWEGFEVAAQRSERDCFISAGRSREMMNTVVDLKLSR